MGTWEYDIFSDDLALDIRSCFEEALAEGLNVSEVTVKVMETFRHLEEDIDKGPVLYLALASLQNENGVRQSDIQQKAVMIIENELGLERWKNAGDEELKKCKLALKHTYEMLIATAK